MYNLVWQSVMCRPGKLLILLIRRIRCCAQPLRPPDDIRPLGKTRRREQANLGRAFALPPSAHPQASHPDCRSVLTLIVAPHPTSPPTQVDPAVTAAENAARILGVRLVVLPVSTEGEIEAAFANFAGR